MSDEEDYDFADDNVSYLSMQCNCGDIVTRDNDEHYASCLPFWRDRVDQREARLKRLEELKAPPVILAKERLLIAQAVDEVASLEARDPEAQ